MTFLYHFRYQTMNLKPTNSYVYLYLISTTSFCFGLWAFIVGFKASLPNLKDFHYTPKIISFQLSLVFLKLQGLIFNMILLPSGAFPCLPPISPTVYANSKSFIITFDKGFCIYLLQSRSNLISTKKYKDILLIR